MPRWTPLVTLSLWAFACSDPPPRAEPPRSIPIEPAAPIPPAQEASLIVWLDPAGDIQLEGRPADLAAVDALARTLVEAAHGNVRAIIRATPGTPHARVVEVIDALRNAGVTRYALDIPPPDPPRVAVPLPAPISVCLTAADGTLLAREAVPSHGGIHYPDSPIVPSALNWRVQPEGCVTYPSSLSPTAVCGDRTTAAPVVTRRLCGR
jgi:biopolymer transport protein ExbD